MTTKLTKAQQEALINIFKKLHETEETEESVKLFEDYNKDFADREYPVIFHSLRLGEVVLSFRRKSYSSSVVAVNNKTATALQDKGYIAIRHRGNSKYAMISQKALDWCKLHVSVPHTEEVEDVNWDGIHIRLQIEHGDRRIRLVIRTEDGSDIMATTKTAVGNPEFSVQTDAITAKCGYWSAAINFHPIHGLPERMATVSSIKGRTGNWSKAKVSVANANMDQTELSATLIALKIAKLIQDKFQEQVYFAQ